MKWALSSVENFFGCFFLGVFCSSSVLDQARLGLDVLPVMPRDVGAGWTRLVLL
jgi:hypothetical protein